MNKKKEQNNFTNIMLVLIFVTVLIGLFFILFENYSETHTESYVEEINLKAKNIIDDRWYDIEEIKKPTLGYVCTGEVSISDFTDNGYLIYSSTGYYGGDFYLRVDGEGSKGSCFIIREREVITKGVRLR